MGWGWYPNREDAPGNAASQGVYRKYRPSGGKMAEFSAADCHVWTNRLAQYGFTRIQSALFRRVRTLTSDAYLRLLNTYSDHRALDPATKLHFERDMKAALDAVGGGIHIYDTIDLYLAQKPAPREI